MPDTSAPSRGFLTIATGREKYYWLAWHLLQSYRFHSEDPLPFAILCDRENRYTKAFDRVIILKDSSSSYNDKLRLPDYVPFDETIFIDADTLAYGDLNRYWSDFEEASDFSAFGYTQPLDSDDPMVWFFPDGMGQWKDQLHFLLSFQGGVYYLRKSPILPKLSALCSQIYDTYGQYRFRSFPKPADETIYALAMSILDLRPVPMEKGWTCYSTHVRYLKCDIRTGRLECIPSWYPEDAPVITGLSRIHWGNSKCSKWPYQREAFRLRCSIHKGHAMTAAFFLRSLPRFCFLRIRKVFRSRKHTEG